MYFYGSKLPQVSKVSLEEQAVNKQGSSMANTAYVGTSFRFLQCFLLKFISSEALVILIFFFSDFALRPEIQINGV